MTQFFFSQQSLPSPLTIILALSIATSVPVPIAIPIGEQCRTSLIVSHGHNFTLVFNLLILIYPLQTTRYEGR
jgi:hypothetical protein